MCRLYSTLNTPCPTTNLARDITGAVMTASSSNPHRIPSRANNGVQFGGVIESWLAADSGPQWLTVDFGEQRNFNTVRIFQAGTRIRDYRIEYSNDGVNWTVIRAWHSIMIQSPQYYQYRHPTTITARYVRLFSGHSAQAATPIGVFEFEVYYLP